MTPLPLSVRHVFVYGTLRQGEQRDIQRMKPAPHWVGRASVLGTLYDLGSYPGLVPARLDEAGQVHGEVYAICAALECQLDDIEEVGQQQSGEYCKQELVVNLERAAGEHPQLRCLIYVIDSARSAGLTAIASGDWVQYRREKGC